MYALRHFGLFAAAALVAGGATACGDLQPLVAQDDVEGSASSTLGSDDDDRETPGGEGGVVDELDTPPTVDLELDPDALERVWIVNSEPGTIAKINAITLEVEARYYTGPQSARDPSRTSVNIQGDVVVANRNGGLTKIVSDPARCQGEQSSGGADEVLDWGEDDCVAWYYPMDQGARVVGWTRGVHRDSQEVWTSPFHSDDAGTIQLAVIDGDSGQRNAYVLAEGVGTDSQGLYGGIVDSQDGLWAITLRTEDEGSSYRPWLFHIGRNFYANARWLRVPGDDPYALTLDADDRVWVGSGDASTQPSLQRYDPDAGEWEGVDLSAEPTTGWSFRSLAVDPQGDLWAALRDDSGGRLLQIDPETMRPRQQFGDTELEGFSEPRGVSIDDRGRVWVVDMEAAGGGAFVLDPTTEGAVHFVGSLNAPDPYSGMTVFSSLPVTLKH